MSDNEIEYVYIGEVMVDSGILMVGDPCYVQDFKDIGDETKTETPNSEGDFSYSYRGAFSASLSGPIGGGMLDRGRAIATSTERGDGYYSVYHIVENGRPVALHVDLARDAEAR